MPQIRFALRANRATQARNWLHRHGWTSGGTVPPADESEEEASLDWRGGGDAEFPVPLVRASNPGGAVVGHGIPKWVLSSARATLLRNVLTQSGWQYNHVDSQANGDDLVWCRTSDYSWDDFLSNLRVPLVVQEPENP